CMMVAAFALAPDLSAAITCWMPWPLSSPRLCLRSNSRAVAEPSSYWITCLRGCRECSEIGHHWYLCKWDCPWSLLLLHLPLFREDPFRTRRLYLRVLLF